MRDGTREDYQLLREYEASFLARLPDTILESVRALDHSLDGYPVTRFKHSLQTATRALNDGADDDMVVAALVHDVGDILAPFNHAAVAADILRPYVRAEVTWVIEQHGLFQSYYYAHHYGANRNGRERFRDHPWFQRCVDFCERWDQASFDPDFPTLPLAAFEPAVRRVFTRPAHDQSYTQSSSPAPRPSAQGA
ncbi:MAG: HD domain-containing protein [Proteobacteria bacterium]|nr:HD domain-containing protein [Pseudomonadota bacterium]